LKTEVTDSLYIDDEGDDVDVVYDLESAFGIKILDEEAQRLRTVGDVFEFIKSKLETKQDVAGHFALSRAFYVVRTILAREFPKARIRPTTKLSSLPLRNKAQLARLFENQEKLILPNRSIGIWGLLGFLLLVISLPSFALVGIFYSSWVPWLILAFGLFLIFADPRPFDKNETVGSLVREIAAKNFMKFQDAEKNPRESDLWNAVIHILCVYTVIKPENIRKDMFLLAPSVYQD
jgi:hypothetical protein